MGTRLLGLMVGLGMGPLPVAILQAIGAGMRLSRVFILLCLLRQFEVIRPSPPFSVAHLSFELG